MKETKFKDTEIGKIPEEWEVKKLGAVFDIGNGRDYKHLNTGKIPVYGTGGLMTYVNEYLYDGETVCIGRKGTINMPQYHNGKIWTVDTLFYTYNFRKTDVKFLYYLTQRIDWNSYNTATGVPSLTSQNISNILVSFPPLHEQHRIVSALTSIDNLISSLGKLIEKKKNIKQGAMQQLLTGKTRLKGFSERWVYRKISEIATTSSGGTPSRSIPSYYYGDIKWFTTTELKDNYLYDSVEHITREALNNSSAKMFSANTILMAMYGATIGKLGVLKEPSTSNQACCAIKCNDIVEIFLFYILLYNRKSIIEKGCGAGQPNISQAIVNELSFLVPPCEKEQQAIANILSKMDNEITALEAKKAKYEAIKQGMMQQLLTGKIRLIS